MFIHPMWCDEIQRIGKQKCTPVGYALHVVADLVGFFGLLTLIGVLWILAHKAFTGGFTAPLLWLLVLPLGLGLIGELLFAFSWKLAERKGFQYDYERREASWEEAGQRRTYRWEP